LRASSGPIALARWEPGHALLEPQAFPVKRDLL
jgi:hypothetical protein